jgi:hypothetical protein
VCIRAHPWLSCQIRMNKAFLERVDGHCQRNCQ